MAVMDDFKTLKCDKTKTLKDFYENLQVAYSRAQPGMADGYRDYDIREQMLRSIPEEVYAKVLNYAPGRTGEEIANHYDGIMAQ